MRKSSPDPTLATRVDEQLSVADHVVALRGCHGSWIRTTRFALGWTLGELGEKLFVSKQALSQLEERELQGMISIRKLDELARAMNCQLVYGFIPNTPMAGTASDLQRRQAAARRQHRKMPRPK